MYDLKRIIEQNQEAEKAGIMKPGEAVGTTGFIPGQSGVNKGWVVGGEEVKGHTFFNGGLRGHSIGPSYPYSVAIGRVTDLSTDYTVVNYSNGQTYNTYRGIPSGGACRAAHAEAVARRFGVSIGIHNGPITGPFNPEW